jgi:hypothetical protein
MLWVNNAYEAVSIDLGNIMKNLLIKRVSGSDGNLKVQHFIKE